MSPSLDLGMVRSRSRASVRGRRGKPGPRSPACRGSAYPAPRGSLVLPASSGKRLLPRDAQDHVAVALPGPRIAPSWSTQTSSSQTGRSPFALSTV